MMNCILPAIYTTFERKTIDFNHDISVLLRHIGDENEHYWPWNMWKIMIIDKPIHFDNIIHCQHID